MTRTRDLLITSEFLCVKSWNKLHLIKEYVEFAYYYVDLFHVDLFYIFLIVNKSVTKSMLYDVSPVPTDLHIFRIVIVNEVVGQLRPDIGFV